ncbi:DUF1648 domain-containing protein [Thermus thermamylovorans]|uniref:DUF1648 domain-containing protein n=1 Tax=Thermus thermamylovorans TaxID=2509362 RepID=A0A4Q9B6Q8_9DEIN|nr:DUF1648 domain-containing protein [Thermus thermamylovorans]TBH20772.1 DUF1648 domain-containing protein [Thermus thermamylovorans]
MGKWLAPLGLLLTWTLTLWAYSQLPERIPAHWNAQGEVTRYGSRLEVFLLPLLLTLLYPLLALAPRLDPKLRGQAPRVWPWLQAGVVWTFALLQGAFLFAAWSHAQGRPFPVEQAILGAVGLVFLVLGLLLPRLPPNYLAGVRTPWTLESPRVWQEVHRRAGRAFVLLGLLAWLAALLGGGWLWVWLAALLAGGLYLVVFSYLAWRKAPGG